MEGLDLTRKGTMRDSAGIGGKLFGRPGWVATLVLAAMVSGCSTLRLPVSERKASVKSVQLTGDRTGPITYPVLNGRVIRFADTYAGTVAQACDDVGARTTNAEIRLMALRWKLEQATSAYTDATGQNPAINGLDLLVLASLSRIVIENEMLEQHGNAVRPLVDAQRGLESNAWATVACYVKPAQERQLQDLIQQWRRQNPHQRDVGQIRFREFVTAMETPPPHGKPAPASILSLLYLDPTAGLDPTVAAIQETRDLGERAMYYSQRMPNLLRWQAELLACELAAKDESRQILADADKFASSAAAIAKATQDLPAVLDEQRRAVVEQVFDGLAIHEDAAKELLTNAGSTLGSLNTAAASVKSAIGSLADFVNSTRSAGQDQTGTDTNGRPFDVHDYGEAATQIGTAASNVNTLLLSVNQNAPGIEELTRQATAGIRRTVHQAFWLGVALVIIAFAAGLAYRIVVNRFASPGS